jgi:hypothetical protein
LGQPTAAAVIVTVVPGDDGDGGAAEKLTDPGGQCPGATNVNWSAVEIALVPAVVVTVTSTVPIACAGLVTVIEVSVLMTTLVPGAVPKCTTKPVLLNWVPVMVTVVPPNVDPIFGFTFVTVGTVH